MVTSKGASLRFRILTAVGGLIVLSIFGSAATLFRVSEVKATLDRVNQRAIPLNRLLGQLQNDVDVLAREMERAMGPEHWSDPHWRSRPLPQWLLDVLTQEIVKVSSLARGLSGARPEFVSWSKKLESEFQGFVQKSKQLDQLLQSERGATARELHGTLGDAFLEISRAVSWGAKELDQDLRSQFALAERRVADLRTGLELALVAIVILSFLLLWLGERALRPLAHLTQLAREITRRGLRRDDKAAWLTIGGAAKDEVGRLAQEFHRMTTALLERERTVEEQNQRLESQNAELVELGRLRERLQAAENLAAVGRLSAQVAHEVRNPLHAIGLEADLALEALKGIQAPNARESMHAILQSVDRLERITENYLKLSRTGQAPGAPANTEVESSAPLTADWVQVLESTLALYSSEFQAHQIRVQWKLPDGSKPVLVRAEPRVLEQVIGNLIRNSIQALRESSTKNPEITLVLASSGSLASMEIWDNGPGISPEHVAHLFQPFMTTRAQGTGLGLSFVKKVVEDWGGQIFLAEARPARFIVRLPDAKLGDKLKQDAGGPHGEHSLSR